MSENGQMMTVEETKPVCSIEGCDAKARARGWCVKHYTRNRKHGSPDVVLVPTAPPVVFEGDRFGRLVVLGYGHTNRHGNRCYRCVCDCGDSTVIRGDKLKSGHTRSCGCLQREEAAAAAATALHRA
jgi:hypothetical protein